MTVKRILPTVSRGRTLIALALLALSSTGCGHMPATSMIRLARVDFETTDPAQLRAAVRLPQVLQPLPHSMVLRVTVTVGRNPPESRDFVLRELPQPAELAGEARAE